MYFTNYYFENDFSDLEGGYRQKGVSKEHRLSYSVQLGLFKDSNNIHIVMKSFPGITSDSITLQPIMAEMRRKFNIGLIIVVADKGLN